MIQTFDLSGTWKACFADGQRGRLEYANRDSIDPARYIDAEVPGEIHLDLVRAGIIEEPNLGINALSARWVEEYQWAYRREFDAPAGAISPGGRAWLVFEGLDYAATVFLNGVEAGRHANFFYPCRIEVTGKLREGKNVLSVHLDSGLWSVAEKPAQGYSFFPDQCLHKRHWLRKPQFQFSWDWSTRLINVGIHKPARLEWTDEAARIDQLAPLATYSMKDRTGSVRTRLFVQGLAAESRKARLVVELLEAGRSTTSECQLNPGDNILEATVDVEHPQLWWPVGCGEQARYTVRASLVVDGKIIGSREARVGFRHVRFNQDPNPAGGNNFILEVNGRQVFCKGGNFVPADMIFARIDRERYQSLVHLALEANFNFLRVWGGGMYESDDFYDLCDERGILVWQEFIFACGRYPTTDEAFCADIRAEAIHNIRRLASHPSLIAWCGNNENEVGAWHWGFDNKGSILPDYGLFHLILPRLMKQEDPTRYYQPSSPWSGPAEDPNRDDTGDQHPWTVGFFNTDFRDYRKMICRFPNEGGILGPTALPTMLACLPDGPQRKVGSFAWQVHDNSIDSWASPSLPDEMIKQWLGLDVKEMTVEDFVYFAGLVQGEGLREYVENFRRRMFNSASAIFWMYNDCWPATRSWTIVDYYLRRTPCFWAVKRAMAPIGLAIAQLGDNMTISGLNDTDHTLTGVLRYGVFDLTGAYQLDLELPVSMASNRATELAGFARREWKGSDASCVFAMLEHEGKIIARARFFEPRFKELRWPRVTPADIKITRGAGWAGFRSEAFAWGVCVDLNGERPLADNFFDVYPGIEHRIAWDEEADPVVLRVGNPG